MSFLTYSTCSSFLVAVFDTKVRTTPITPAINKMMPIVFTLNPSVSTDTANAKTAPNAMRKIEPPKPAFLFISSLLLSFFSVGLLSASVESPVADQGHDSADDRPDETGRVEGENLGLGDQRDKLSLIHISEPTRRTPIS